MAEPRRIGVKIGATTLTRAFNVEWDIVGSDTGSGSFALMNTDAQIAVPKWGDLAELTLDGVVFHRFFLNNIDRTQIAEGNEADQFTTFGGPSNESILEDSVVYPSAGITTIPSGPLAGFRVGVSPIGDDRFMSYLTADHNRASWGSAAALGTMSGADRPRGMPDRSTQWISLSSSTAARTELLYSTFSVSSTCWAVKAFAVCRGEIRGVWINGVPVMEAGGPSNPAIDLATNAWESVFGVTEFFGSNTIVVAVQRDTVSTPGFAMTMYEHGTSTVVSRTGSSWKAINVDNVTTMTWGSVIRTLISEGLTRGDIVGVTTSFTDTVDSSGAAWDAIGDLTFSLRIGDTIDDVLRIAAQQGVEYAMATTATKSVLSMWKPGTVSSGGRGSSTPAATYSLGVNCIRHSEAVNG